MKDLENDGKIKDIEKEIDNAIDQLFVDKIPSESSSQEEIQPEEKFSMDMEDVKSELIEEGKGEEEKAEVSPEEGLVSQDETGDFLEEIDSLKEKVKKFLEWGVTGKALDNIQEGTRKIKDEYPKNKLIDSVTRMMSDILDFLRQNPDSHLNEMVDFLISAFGALEKLIRSDKDREIDGEGVFNSINAQFSTVSSLLTFEIPNIELEESFSVPGSEVTPAAESDEDSGKDETIEPAEIEEVKDGTDIVDMTFLEPEKVEEPFQEEISEDSVEKLKGEKKVWESLEAEQPPETPAVGMEVQNKNFETLLMDFSQALKEAQKAYFLANNILDVANKLSTEIDALVAITNRFMAIVSTGIPSDKDLKQLQAVVNEINRDFGSLSNSIGTIDRESQKVTEIIPVTVGRKMIGLPSQSVEKVYAISQKQEKQFKENGFVKIKDNKLPFMDLLSEFGEVSKVPDKRVVVMETPVGKKAILVDKVLKKRFALVSEIGHPDLPKMAKFYFAEEMPIYEIS